MANAEHLKRVLAGREAILEWRDEFPHDQLDLSGANLERADLRGANLKWADFTGAQMRKCQLAGANLTQAVLSQAQLRSADCREANFRGAILREADLTSADCSLSDFHRANLSRARLKRTKFFRATLQQADLSLTEASKADFSQADLRSTKLQNATLFLARFFATTLDGALLDHADLRRATFERCSLKATSFHHSLCGGTVWGELDLSQALQLASLRHQGPSILDVATLSNGATLPQEFLSGCGFDTLTSARLRTLGEVLAVGRRAYLSCDIGDLAVVEQVAGELFEVDVVGWPDPWDKGGAMPCHRWTHGALLGNERILVCVSEGLLANPSANVLFEQAMAAEERLQAEGNHAERVVMLVDLDGSLQSEDLPTFIPGDAESRCVADFSNCIRDPKQLEVQLGRIRNALAVTETETGAKPAPSATADPVDELRALIGKTDRLRPGFAKLVATDGGQSIWYNYRGQKVPSYHLRQKVRGLRIEWESPAVEQFDGNYVYFVFAGGLGNRSAPKTGGFELRINGFGPLDFDVVREPRCWQSEDKQLTLFYSPQWQSRDDSAGFFYVAVAQSCLRKGESCRFMVRSKGENSRRWFGIQPTTETVDLQRDSILLSSFG